MNVSKTILILLIAIIGCLSANGADDDSLYSAAYGRPSDPAIIFLHGGPGYNAATFELGAAQALASNGYFVIVYDRRGSGRSQGFDGAFTFDETIEDLEHLYHKYSIDRANLIGHSFGGAVATMFASANPNMVGNIILVGAPLNYPETFRAIQKNCREVYTAQKDSNGLRYLDMLATMDSTVLRYANYSFLHAMKCGLYSVKEPTAESKEIFREMSTSPYVRFVADMQQKPVEGFFESHAYTTLNFSDTLKKVDSHIIVYGIYGVEDGLFSAETRRGIAETLGQERFFAVKGASHSVFIDQRARFLQLIGDMTAP